MAYCFKNGKRMKVTSELLMPSKQVSSRGYSPQMKPYSSDKNDQSLWSKNMLKCFLAFLVIMIIVLC